MGYVTDGWSEFFVAAAGATAALAGLIFVSLSVNIERVLQLDKEIGESFLTGRAFEGLAALVSVLGISIVALTLGIARGPLAAFVIFVAALTVISPLRALSHGAAKSKNRVRVLIRFGLALALSATLAIAGITLAIRHGGGLYWLPAAFVLGIRVARSMPGSSSSRSSARSPGTGRPPEIRPTYDGGEGDGRVRSDVEAGDDPESRGGTQSESAGRA